MKDVSKMIYKFENLRFFIRKYIITLVLLIILMLGFILNKGSMEFFNVDKGPFFNIVLLLIPLVYMIETFCNVLLFKYFLFVVEIIICIFLYNNIMSLSYVINQSVDDVIRLIFRIYFFVIFISFIVMFIKMFMYYKKLRNFKKMVQVVDIMNVMNIKVRGMMCDGCEKRVQNIIFKVNGVKSVKADYITGNVKIEYLGKVNFSEIKRLIENNDYFIEE